MLSEAFIMLVAMIVAARWVIRRFDVPRTLPATVSMGLIAIGLLFPAEIAGVVWVRGLSVQNYLTGFLTAPGVVSLLDVPAFRRDADACDAGWVSFPA
jgi:endonuclease/exonuclease/phosphatase (EEP) superfamily protein YafD